MTETLESRTLNIWDKNLDKLLRAWQAQIIANINAHRIEASKLKRRYYVMGGSATVLGAIVTAVGLTFSQNPEFAVSISQNVAMGCVAALTGLVTFLGDDGKSTKHHEAANKYQALHLLISNILAIPRDQRDDGVEVLNSVREQFDDITNASPMLSDDPSTLRWKFDGSYDNKAEIETKDEDDTYHDISSNTDENTVSIHIDLDAQPASAKTNMETQTRMQNELCGVTNRNNRYGVITQMQYQLQRMDSHNQD